MLVFFYLDGDDLPLWIVCPVPLSPVLGETCILLVGVCDLVQSEEEYLPISEMTLKPCRNGGEGRRREVVTEVQD